MYKHMHTYTHILVYIHTVYAYVQTCALDYKYLFITYIIEI